VGPRHKVTCAEITTSDGNNLPWVNEIRYLGIFIVSFVSFKCSTDHAKRSFHRAANAIFAKVKGKGKGKAEHLYSALHVIQTTPKCSGMDHTVLPATNTIPAFYLVSVHQMAPPPMEVANI